MKTLVVSQGFMTVRSEEVPCYIEWDGLIIHSMFYKEFSMTTKIRQVLSSSSINGTEVQNMAREDLGKIQDLMIDLSEGRIAYAVLSFGGFLGMGDKYFAIPWEAFQVVQEEKVFLLNVPKEKLEQAPGFDKDKWPDFADTTWGQSIHEYYGYNPYWG